MIIKLIYTSYKLDIERWQEKNIIHSFATQRLSQSKFCFVSLKTFSYIYETFSKSLKSISYSAKSPCNYIDELQTSANTHFPNHQYEEWSGIWSYCLSCVAKILSKCTPPLLLPTRQYCWLSNPLVPRTAPAPCSLLRKYSWISEWITS